jgi:DNA modification methylase
MMTVRIDQGDARELIKTVDDSTVATIYFDPPFNTGKEFKLDAQDETGFSDVFSSDDEYIRLIEPVLNEAVRVLKKDGSLFFHISAEEMLIPHILCKKYFSNVQPIFWQRARSKNNVKNKLGAVTDVIFWCSNVSKPKYNLVYQPLDEYYAENSYKNSDWRGNYALGHLVYTKTQRTKREDRYYTMEVGEKSFQADHGWRVSKEDLEKLFAEDRVHVPASRGNLYRKIYKHESKGKPATNLWDDVHSIAMGSEDRKYPTQKPVKLLERIIKMSSDPGDTILDPMAGSGTTGVAAIHLGRDAILMEENPEAVEIMANKFKT